MTMPNTKEKGKLIEVLSKHIPYGYATLCLIADELMAEGVTVQECKVGDTIYEVDGEHGIVKHDVYEVCVVFKTTATDDKGNEWDDYWTTDDIGNAYKTRNEAEAKLPQPPKDGE